MMIFIPIGGYCAMSQATRPLTPKKEEVLLAVDEKVVESIEDFKPETFYLNDLTNIEPYPYALPFDYIRCRFDKTIELLENNFSHFLPTDEELQTKFLDENTTTVDMDGHIFFHHNLKEEHVRQNFCRRIERFQNDVLFSSRVFPVTFVRAITSKYIMTELRQIETFLLVLQKRNPNLSFQLIMIGHHENREYITFKKLDFSSHNVYYFHVPAAGPSSYRMMFTYLNEHGFPKGDQEGIFYVDLEKKIIVHKEKNEENHETEIYYHDLVATTENYSFTEWCENAKEG